MLRNEIGDEGAHNLGEALKRNTSLKKLDLLCILIIPLLKYFCLNLANKINTNGIYDLLNALKSNTTLTDLYLKGKHTIPHPFPFKYIYILSPGNKFDDKLLSVVESRINRNKRLSSFTYVKKILILTVTHHHFVAVQTDFLESGPEEICSWLEDVNKNDASLLRILKLKNITGEDILRIIDSFTTLVKELKQKSQKPKTKISKCLYKTEKRKQKHSTKLPSGWKEVIAPAGNTFFYNTKTGVAELEAPEMTVSDRPFNENAFMKASSLDIFQRMPQYFYETLDDTFKSAKFKNLAEIRKKSQENVIKLIENGELGKWGMNKEEAEVLFSYSFEAENTKETPCYIVNKALADRDDNNLRNYRGYILHLLKALRKLRPIPTITPTRGRTTLYRGIDGKFLNFDDEHYKVGNTLSWPAFTSTTTQQDVVFKQFLVRAVRPIIFEIHGDFVGYSIKAFSNFPNEDEVLLEPETTFKIVSIENDMTNPKVKRIIVDVQPTPLIIKETVENFARAEWSRRQQQNNINYITTNFYQGPKHQVATLPQNWIQCIDQTGRIYYVNAATKVSQWNFPMTQ